VVASGTAGPLRGGFGGVRDHVLGLTLVTGDGRVLKAGGIVVKNVAGFDLVKLATGSFGAFGVVTTTTFRLRTVPRASVTLLGNGPRPQLLDAAGEILAAGITPVALELLSPAGSGGTGCELAIRLVGSNAEVAAARDAIRRVTDIALPEVSPSDTPRLWHTILSRTTHYPLTVRLGALPSSIDRTLDLTSHYLTEGWTTASMGVGVVRWSGAAPPEDLRRLRHAAAQLEIPVTLERATWNIRAAVGHFGAYREGVGQIVSGLRHVFDPARVIVSPLESES
jgi:FAD/FMN-containing dehydrogenase